MGTLPSIAYIHESYSASMKVVFLSDDFPPSSFGGAGFSTYELAKGVQKAGHEVLVVTTCREASDAGEFAYEGLTVFRIASDYHERWRAWLGLYNPPVVRQVEKLLRRLQPDVVHANNTHYYLSYHCLTVAKRHAKTVVWTARDTMSISYGKLDTPRYLETLDTRLSWFDNLREARLRYNPLRNYLIRRYLRSADVRLAVSSALKDALERNGIQPVETLHTGMEATAWQASPEALAAFRSKFGLEGKQVILFGGRLSAGKGQGQALEAARLVRELIPESVLLIMGGSEQKEDTGIAQTGWITGEEKKAAYAASDIVWVPSVYLDPLPRMALEAQASGKPVIATKFGGAPELVQDGETGYVVNPLYAQEIADKTIDLLQHPERAVAMGHSGRARIQSDFNLNKKVAELIALYGALVRK